MSGAQLTDRLDIAMKFVNSTNRHIFLTGKAGTGKTTFLRSLSKSTHKRHIIVAPTGIAALNAGGSTIHSQFLLPFGTFIPDRNFLFEDNFQSNFFTPSSLIRKHPLNSIRKQFLRSIDLLIIDEVSMLRADILDAIDYRMRVLKGKSATPFGGVQVLMIGDLFQLPPIIKDQERPIMDKYYNSAHFFEALALKQEGFILVELDKIFRQHDENFIRLLNNLRNNIATEQDIATLNSFYQPSESRPSEDIITITTHNRIADDINYKALNKLNGPSFYFEAEVEDEFPENLFPISESLELRVGSQIMFVKNDSLNKAYFNGKLAVVDSLKEDEIVVKMAETHELFTLRKEEWENKRYSIHSKSKELVEDVIGRFRQYPIKLAWAITVHKSQGLTFEKAIIDVGNAFAPGQVYVALSRLTSLNGLTLRTYINPDAVTTDRDVQLFTREKANQPELSRLLQDGQQEYLQIILNNTFDFSEIIHQIEYAIQKFDIISAFELKTMREALIEIKSKLLVEQDNTSRFRAQLSGLLRNGEEDKLRERIEKGSKYYQQFIWLLLKDLLMHLSQVQQLAKTKTYQSALTEIDLMLMIKYEELQKVTQNAFSILDNRDLVQSAQIDKNRITARLNLDNEIEAYSLSNPLAVTGKTGRKKAPKGETYRITYQMFSEGLDVAAIANMRKLSKTTIEGHIARGVAEGEIDIKKVMPDNIRLALISFISERTRDSVVKIYEAGKGKYSYFEIKVVLACMRLDIK